MKDRNTRISALNRQLRPIEQRLQKLWEELQEARRQWTALREPDVKYGRGDYELLRSVLDEWLRVDGAWPAAHCWGALCAYELGDVRMARDYYERARKFQAETLGGEARSDAQLRALEGLILMKQERGSARAKQSLHVAEQLAEKSKKRVKDWEPFFLVGRSWADGLTEADQRKAIKKFETALKHHPECQSADIWKARIQTTTPFEKLRDLEAGIATLERHWTATGRRSWRLALDLARAYRAAEQLSQSQQLFDQALELAPVEQRRSLEEEWQTPPE